MELQNIKETIMAETLKDKLSVKEKWIKLIFIVIYALVIYWIAFALVWIITAFQFLYTLFTGKANKTLQPFSKSLSEYIKQIVSFLMYDTEEKPFPFTPWPETKVAKPAAPRKAAPRKKAPTKPKVKKEAEEK